MRYLQSKINIQQVMYIIFRLSMSVISYVLKANSDRQADVLISYYIGSRSQPHISRRGDAPEWLQRLDVRAWRVRGSEWCRRSFVLARSAAAREPRTPASDRWCARYWARWRRRTARRTRSPGRPASSQTALRSTHFTDKHNHVCVGFTFEDVTPTILSRDFVDRLYRAITLQHATV